MIYNVTAVFDIIENYFNQMSLPDEVHSALSAAAEACNTYLENVGCCAYDIDELDNVTK